MSFSYQVAVAVIMAVLLLCLVEVLLQTRQVQCLTSTPLVRSKTSQLQPKNHPAYTSYVPASTEDWIVSHATELQFDLGKDLEIERRDISTEEWLNFPLASGCNFWKDQSLTNPQVFSSLNAYRDELRDYENRVKKFRLLDGVTDLRKHVHDNNTDICESLQLHPEGLPGIFKSGQISLTPSGYIEPLLPPMRHPEFCFNRDRLMDTSYLVHDMPALCRKLKPTSRTIFIDMGASLLFHATNTPAVYLVEMFRKFGFPFDHNYAFEVSPTEPATVFELVPKELFASYHWINVGVSADPDSQLNPLRMLLDNYNEDDLIIVKLDIDTAAIEVPLAQQILNDDRLCRLIDQFYFEHHVRMSEIAPNWKFSMDGSIRDTLELFSGLRKKGVPAHFWV